MGVMGVAGVRLREGNNSGLVEVGRPTDSPPGPPLLSELTLVGSYVNEHNRTQGGGDGDTQWLRKAFAWDTADE